MRLASIPIIVFCFACLLRWDLVVSQPAINEFSFKRFSVRDGLIDNEVHAVAQDSLGYIWCGTESGLSRFDGVNFISFNTKSNPDLLHSNYVERLKSYKGNLFVFGREGFDLIQTPSMKSQEFDFNSEIDAVEAKAAYDARFYIDGSVLITTHAGFFEFDSKGKTLYSYQHFNKDKKNHDRVFFGQEIFKVNSNEVLFYAQDIFLYHYDRQTRALNIVEAETAGKWKPFIPWKDAYTIKKELAEGEFLLLSFAKKKYRYINLHTNIHYEGELPEQLSAEFYWNSYVTDLGGHTYAINAENSGFYTFRLNHLNGQLTFDLIKHLPEVRCYIIFVGADGRRWIGSNKGLWMEMDFPPAIKVQPFVNTVKKNQNLFLSGMARFGDSLILSSPSGDAGMVLFNTQSNKVLSPISFENKEFNLIKSIKKINSHELLVIGQHLVYTLDLHTLLPKVVEFRDEDLVLPLNDNPNYIHILSSSTGTLFRFEKKTGQILAYPDSTRTQFTFNDRMFYDKMGSLWLAGNQLIEVDSKGDVKIHHSANPEHLDLGRYLSISVSENEKIWLGTLSGNLLEFDPLTSNSTVHLENDQMMFPIVSVSQPVDGTIFFSGGDRFYAYSFLQKTTIEISKATGFPEEKIMSKQFVFNHDSSVLYATTINHLIGINLLKHDPKPQLSGISSIALDFHPVLYHPDLHFSLPYDGEVMTMLIGNMDFPTSPQQIEYKLDGDEWRQASPELTFNKLSFGRHRLNIRHTYLFGEKNQLQYQFTLVPPFYKSNWFRGILVMTLILCIGIEIRRRYLVRQKIWNLNLALAESQIKALHSQMNPHFIFNSLNSIKAMILDHNTAAASKYLSVFSSLIRQNLSHGKQPFISLDEQIKYIHQYLEIEILRNDQLTYDFVVSEEVDMMDLIPPMIIQPIVENAIWHGMVDDESRNSVRIRLSMEGQEIVFQVEDNGNGIAENFSPDSVAGNSIALQNILQRVDLYNQKYNLKGSIKFVNKQDLGLGSGTLVEFRYQSDVHV